jgi:hypothetical protein
VIGIVTPEISTSWKASVPIEVENTWPVMASSGTESMWASAIAVTKLVAPGPEVAIATPKRPTQRVAFGGVASTLFVPNQNVANLVSRHQFVIKRHDRATGQSEDVGDSQEAPGFEESLRSRSGREPWRPLGSWRLFLQISLSLRCPLSSLSIYLAVSFA